MAKKHPSLNKINFPSLCPLSICVALVCLLQLHQATGIECGSDNYIDPIISPRISGGEEADREQWPFIAALYIKSQSQPEGKLKFFCGGTLVSNRHILTAAHCIHEKGKSLSRGDIEVRLGAYNISASEKDVVLRNVFNISIHEHWNVDGDTPYDADVAILVLSDNVTFTTHIRPISLPTIDVFDPSSTVSGTVVGWARTDSLPEDIPRQVAITTYDSAHCFLRYRDLNSLSSERTFCAGSGEGSPTKGDSGGGFFVKIGDAWQQYGIISSIKTDAKGHVIRNEVAIYTNVNLFRDWIVDKVEETGGVVGEPIMEINMRCEYRIYELEYECYLRNLDIRTENIAVACVTGSHNEEVKKLNFADGTMITLPYGVGKMFKNVRAIHVTRDVKGTKLITRPKLQNLKQLERLQFERNEIGQLKFNALWDLPSLKIFRLIYNNIEELHSQTFKNNDNLMEVDLRCNRLKSLPMNLFQYNNFLEKVDLGQNALTKIEYDFSSHIGIKEIYLDNNVCIDVYFSDDLQDFPNDPERITTLSKLQRLIRNNCHPI